MKRIVSISIFLVFFATVGASVFIWKYYINQAASDSDQEVIFEVIAGKTFHQVAKELEQKQIVRNAQIFSLFARTIGQANKIKIGEYALKGNMLPKDILGILTSGKSIRRPFTVAEGLNIFEIAEAYDKAGFGNAEIFLQAAQDPSLVKYLLGDGPETLEGYLFPETYQITKFTTTRELITQMVKNFDAKFIQVQKIGGQGNLTKHQVVTLASIIEKETGAPEERPLISSVFHNRLRKGMLLQTDPTILYGIADETKKLAVNITKADILRRTRYNTYVVKGLPPGPISNPGKAALIAALNPIESDFLFFVSHNDGTHAFSQDLKKHNAAVKKFQLDRNAREGKSWRDLNKKLNKDK